MTSQCPVCSDALGNREIDTDLFASSCDKCGGMWLGAMQYENWRQKQAKGLDEKPADQSVQLTSGETPGARFCPQCKYVLMKYKVGHQTGFSLNRCGNCAGIWFDKNEWEILKSRNLHERVHMVFSQAWQSAVRAEQHRNAMDEFWRNELGDKDLTEIRRIKDWLAKHPKSAELYAYLLADREEKAAATR